jgi:outer membrane lipoprotein SlyB
MKLRILAVPVLLVALGACEDTGGYGGNGGYANAGYANAGTVQAQKVRTGTVVDARTVRVGSNNEVTGAVVGGLAGALVGNQFGKGSGNALMTGVGAMGGAVAGSQIARQNGGGGQVTTEWTVRLDNGKLVRFVQPVSGVRIGDRVSVVPSGNGWRMVF